MTRTIRQTRAITFTCLICVLCSCGDSSINGGGIGGTGKTTTVEDDGLILGKVNGFGSIVINDQHFDTDTATIIVDGKEASITDIQIGMNISARVNFSTMLASRVFYQPLVTGPIERSENSQDTLSILGQSILITPETVLDGLTLDSLQADLIIEVGGTRDSNQFIVADYITVAAENTPFYTVGVINNVNPENTTALLSGTTINYLALTVDRQNESNDPAGQLKPGNRVKVEVNKDALENHPPIVSVVNPAAPKTENELAIADAESIVQFDYPQGSRVEIAGRINTLSSDGAFMVSGVTVYADITTKFYSQFGVFIENPVLRNNEAVTLQGTAIGTRRITAQRITLNDRL